MFVNVPYIENVCILLSFNSIKGGMLHILSNK